MSDERRWTLHRKHPFATMIDGPKLELGESVVVVPAGSPSGEPLTREEMGRVYVGHAEECPSHSVFPAQCDCGHQELKARVRAALAGQDDDGTDHG